MSAGVAFSTKYLRLDGDALSNREVTDICTKGDNLTGQLMALRNGVGGKRVHAMVNMNIASADADPFDFNQYLTTLWLRYRNSSECDLSRSLHHLLEHGAFHNTIPFSRPETVLQEP